MNKIDSNKKFYKSEDYKRIMEEYNKTMWKNMNKYLRWYQILYIKLMITRINFKNEIINLIFPKWYSNKRYFKE